MMKVLNRGGYEWCCNFLVQNRGWDLFMCARVKRKLLVLGMVIPRF